MRSISKKKKLDDGCETMGRTVDKRRRPVFFSSLTSRIWKRIYLISYFLFENKISINCTIHLMQSTRWSYYIEWRSTQNRQRFGKKRKKFNATQEKFGSTIRRHILQKVTLFSEMRMTKHNQGIHIVQIKRIERQQIEYICYSYL